MIWHAGLLHRLNACGISDQRFGLISLFLNSRQIQLILYENSMQEYPVNDGVPQGSILGPTPFLLYISNLPYDVTCNIDIYADDTTLYSKYNQASDVWQQLELASELESDLQDTVDWIRKWFVDINTGKTQLVLSDLSSNSGTIDVKINGSALEEKTRKSYFKMLGLSFSTNLD